MSALTGWQQRVFLGNKFIGLGKFQGVVQIIAFESMFDILDDHLVQANNAFLSAQQVFTNRNSHRQRNVLMFSNRLDFAFIEAAASNKISL